MLSVEEARRRLFEFTFAGPKQEKISLDQALGRYAAETRLAKEASPPWDNSAMDGYAVHTETSLPAGTCFQVQTEIAAGDTPSDLHAGCAARIFTGAPLPRNANAVLIQENAECFEQAGQPYIRLTQTLSANANVRPAGQDFQVGDNLIQQGERLTPATIALLASSGCASLSVFTPLRVGIISTGSELVPTGQARPEFGLYNSNGPMLKALCATAGTTVTHEAHVVDDLEGTCGALQTCARSCDLVISSGGVSVGQKDYMKTAIETLGKLDFWKVQMKPGKPFSFGVICDDVPILSLPGNPASAFVTFLLFAKALIQGAYNQSYTPLRAVDVPADFDSDKIKKRPEYARAVLKSGRLALCQNQSSGMLSPLAQCDGLALLAADQTIAKNDLLPFYSIHDLIYR